MSKRAKSKKVPYIWCHYKGDWTPKGRSRKKCPVCGAVLARVDAGHKVKLMAKRKD